MICTYIHTYSYYNAYSNKSIEVKMKFGKSTTAPIASESHIAKKIKPTVHTHTHLDTYTFR